MELGDGSGEQKIANYLEFLGEAKGDFPGVRLIRGLVPILDLRGSGGAK